MTLVALYIPSLAVSSQHSGLLNRWHTEGQWRRDPTTMTLAELSTAGLDLVVFLTSLINFHGAIGYAEPEVAIVLYIISKLLPRFEELSGPEI